jgi:hypothetical protein
MINPEDLLQDGASADEAANRAAALREKFVDVLTPGFQVEFSPLEAELAGAFVEDALSEHDALESAIDLSSDTRPAG